MIFQIQIEIEILCLYDDEWNMLSKVYDKL